MITLSSETFEQTIKENRTVFVDFWAEWCTACRAFSQMLAAQEKNFPKVVFATANIEEMPEMAQRFNISSLPAIFCFHDGEIHAKDNGVVPPQRIKTMIPDEML